MKLIYTKRKKIRFLFRKELKIERINEDSLSSVTYENGDDEII